MKNNDSTEAPDEFYLVGSEKAIRGGTGKDLMQIPEFEAAVSKAVEVSANGPAVIYRCVRRLRITG